MRIVHFEHGYAILGTWPDVEVVEKVLELAGPFPLTIADPPYGNILTDDWDKTDKTDEQFAARMVGWTRAIEHVMLPGGALYVWGGIGRPLFRPFYRYLCSVEHDTGFTLSTHITWSKRRAYGIQWGYLFTREECAYLVLGDPKKPRLFQCPYLDEERGYPGWDKDHPAKDSRLRRTNVWRDITEIFRGKVLMAQKPTRLYEIPIEVHTKVGEWVLDPFAGSGTTAVAATQLGRKFVLVEQDEGTFEILLANLKTSSKSAA